MLPVYLDYNSTTPYAPEVVKAIQDSLQDWGNPSSSHALGRRANEIIETSRIAVAAMIGGIPEDIVFTSGGTEANNVAILSGTSNMFENGDRKNPHVVTSNVEHDSVMKCLELLNRKGEIELSIAPVSPTTGKLEVATVMNLIKANTNLVTVMHANNETGITMPIAEIGKELKILNNARFSLGLPRILFHTDAAQTIGKIPVSVNKLGVDYMTIVGHKFYGPRIGALYARNIGAGIPIEQRTPIVPIVQGGGQERGFRPGTQNTSMISGLGAAARLVTENILRYNANMEKCRNDLHDSLNAHIPGSKVNFLTVERLPNTLSIAVPADLTGTQVLARCNGMLHASLGAACHSDRDTPSSILIESGLSEEIAKRTIRLSVGRELCAEEIAFAVETLSAACKPING